jgi:hypothetical protein
MRLALVALTFVIVVTGCASEPETYTCESGRLLTPEDDTDLQDLWYGTYLSTWNTDDVAGACFLDGRSLGVAEMACAIIEEIDGDDSGYTLMFTDDGGDTYPVLASEHIKLGPDVNGLDSLARKLPFLSACPTTVPPIEE